MISPKNQHSYRPTIQSTIHMQPSLSTNKNRACAQTHENSLQGNFPMYCSQASWQAPFIVPTEIYCIVLTTFINTGVSVNLMALKFSNIFARNMS